MNKCIPFTHGVGRGSVAVATDRTFRDGQLWNDRAGVLLLTLRRTVPTMPSPDQISASLRRASDVLNTRSWEELGSSLHDE